MRTSLEGIKLIQHFEGCVLHPYRCQAGIPTIGWGNTFYPNGKKVTMADRPITQAEADAIFLNALGFIEKDVCSLIKVPVKICQFDSCVSFAYNVGPDMNHDGIAQGFGDSTLLKLINANPNSDRITGEFMKWNHAAGKVCSDLTQRRRIEAAYYTTGKINF